MNDQEIAKRIADAADRKLGVVLLGDVPQAEIDYALQQKWIVTRGVATFEITERGRSAASS